MKPVAWESVGSRYYRVLNHEGSWNEDVAMAFADGGASGLAWSMKRPRRAKPLPTDGLLRLTGLRLLTLRINGADDSVVPQLSELETMSLLTRSPTPLDLSRLASLWGADLDDRPGLQGFPESLESLSLALSRRTDLRWLEGLRRLQSVKVEGCGQPLTLSGLPNLPALRDLFLDKVLVATGGQLELPRLEHVSIYADEPGDADFDAAVFAGCQALKEIRVRGPVRVRGLRELASLPNLRVAAVIGPEEPQDAFPQLRYVPWHGKRRR